MEMTKKDYMKKVYAYDDRLTPRDLYRANRYAWYSFLCLAVTLGTPVIFFGFEQMTGFGSVIGLVVSIVAISFGFSMINTAKAAFIRKYIKHLSYAGVYHFDARAITAAKGYLILGYAFLILGLVCIAGVLWFLIN
ncbi:MAG: hypothetical protein WC813_04090 [Patescibacteria group bacterium]|jgi:hypothetical protein